MSARTRSHVTGPDGTTVLERPYHHGNLREELIAVGMALGEEGGPDVITLREAARRAGVAANAAYRHFDDLRHLRAEVALRARARLAEAMREELDRRPPRPTAAASAREQLAAVGRGYIRFALRSPNLFRCAWMECPTPDPEPSAWSTLHEALDACARAGVLPGGKTEAAAAAAWSLVHGFAELALRGLLGAPNEQALDELGDRVVEVFLNGALTNGSQRG
jgi:AcrR family transcriptional regulator